MQQAVCVRSKEKRKKNEIPPHSKHKTKCTAARRPRPPRDGVQRNTSHALAHTRTLPPYPGFVEIGLACIHTYSHCCCAACIRFGALFRRQRSFFLYCGMHLRFRGCPVVLDIELSVSAWYQKTRRVLLRARRLLLLLLLAAERGGVRCAA